MYGLRAAQSPGELEDTAHAVLAEFGVSDESHPSWDDAIHHLTDHDYGLAGYVN
jgi:hypothetical protein